MIGIFDELIMDLDDKCSNSVENEILPKIRDSPNKADLAIQKLKFCQLHGPICHDPTAQSTSCQMATCCVSYLEELREYLSTTKGAICEGIYLDFFAMISKNVIRDLHPPKWEDDEEEEELNNDHWENDHKATPTEIEEGNIEPAGRNPVLDEYKQQWKCLKLIYELFLLVLESPDFRVTQSKKYIDQQFVHQLITILANVPLKSERECLALAIRRIYTKFIRFRQFIRKQIIYSLLEAFYDDQSISQRLAPVQKFYGIAELLDVLEEVINAFKVPLKENDSQLLFKVLLPLHRMSTLKLFYKKLIARILQLIGLDSSLAKATIEALLKYWPKTSGSDEVIFMDELEMLMSAIDRQTFKELAVLLFTQLSKSISGQHFQVSAKVFNLWKNDQILGKIEENSAQIIPILFEPLEMIAKKHWNAKIRMMAKEVQNALMAMNWKEWNKMAERQMINNDA